MTVTLPALLRDAWASWRHDKDLLIAIAGPFVFLPALAVALLVPEIPELAAGADPAVPATLIAYRKLLTDWVMHYGLWILLTELVLVYGQFALVALYVSGARPAVGSALVAALRRFPVLLLAMVVIAVPIAMLSLLFVAIPFLLPGHVIVMVIVGGRALLVMPVVHAEAPIGPVAAVGRSFRMTRGHTLVLAAALLTVLLATVLATLPFSTLDDWMAGARNPVAEVIVDSLQAMVTALGSIVMALVQVAAYRRISSR